MHYGIRTESRFSSNRGAPDDSGVIIASTRAPRNFGTPGTEYPVLVGETTITTYWYTPPDGSPTYLVVDIDTSGNAETHGEDQPTNLKVTVNDGTVYPQNGA